ncbi:MAG: Mu transposase C-terminal domain-containing protein [Donghicola eburneus]|nr:Mu transposase C-terminal domain-containing protein [Donghicola eburneus]MCI5038998.1 Mu transposase C-terminal domain-containing protein [Donghicola eburneus]
MTRVPLFRLRKGSILVMDGRRLRVAACEESSVYLECEDTGECISRPFAQIEAAIRARDCDVISPDDVAKRAALLDYTGGYEDLAQLPEKARADVQGRLALVTAMRSLMDEGVKLTQRSMNKCGEHRYRLLEKAHEFAPQCNFLRSPRGGKSSESFLVPQGRTLDNYFKTYEKFGHNPVVLADRDHLKGSRESRLVPWQKNFVMFTINRLLQTKKPPSQKVYENAKDNFYRSAQDIALNPNWPSITTIRKYYCALNEATRSLGLEGTEHAYNTFGAGTTDVRALLFGEKYEWDQVLLSIFTRKDGTLGAEVIDPKTAPEELGENEVCRCWLHVILDIGTRMPLGWIIAESADADHSKALLRMATRDKTKEKVRYDCQYDPAPPVRLCLGSADNGSATRNSEVYSAQLGMDMVVQTNRTYIANDKPYVERLFGTMQGKVLSVLPGYTGSHPKHLPGYDSKGLAKVTHDQLYGMITRYFVDEYAYEKHRGTGMFRKTPRAKLEDALALYGPIDPPSQRDRILHLGVRRQASTTSEGVRVFNIPFNSTELQRFAGGGAKRVTVHLDPDDLRRVLITAEGLDEVVEARLSMTVFNDLTLEEAIEVMEMATKENPERGALHERNLQSAKERHAREDEAFSDDRDPSNFQGIEKLQKRSDRALRVEVRPPSYLGSTVAPGAIMDRTSAAGVVSVKPTSGNPPQNAPAKGASRGSENAPSDIKNMTFGPVKDSKL